jgi:DNA repair protein RadD
MQLRDYQIQLQDDVISSWNQGHKNVMAVSPTGSGKTHTATNLIARTGFPTVFIAHRQELVLQISESLAGQGIYHNIIAPKDVVGFCVERHQQKFRRSYYKSNAPVSVAGVRTLITRQSSLRTMLNSTRLWITDEAHHVLPGNQWGDATKLFPDAYGLGVTATPLRCDRKALDGIFTDLVVGPSMRQLINQGHLVDYRIYCAPPSIDINAIRVSDTTGEYVHKDVIREVEKSQIVGDVVATYLKFAPGERGLTFAVDLNEADKLAQAYNAAGVPAAVVSAETPDRIRTNMLDRLGRGDIKQIVNVDLFGEGMDCPSLDVVSMARPTQSYGLYVQQFGRVLRTSPGKSHGKVIDHVNNVIRHLLPDTPRQWSLSAPERKSRDRDPDEIGLTACVMCYQPYNRIHPACPHCGHKPVPQGRSLPQQVDGDIFELDPAALARLRGEVARIDSGPQIPTGASPVVAKSIKNNWAERQTEQNLLRDTIAKWAGIRKYQHNESDAQIYRRFFHGFGVDIMTAQTLNAKDAATLREKLNAHMGV